MRKIKLIQSTHTAMRAFSVCSTTVLLATLTNPAVSASDASVLEEIMVTAEKRTNNLQDSAVSVTALSADSLNRAGVMSTNDLQGLVPGLTLGSGQSPVIGLRGISSDGNLPTGDPAVAFHVDGVYLSRSSAVKAGFYDLERVEVLRGPQGILYGRNVTGGSINVITNKPNFEGASGSIEAHIGNYNRRNIKSVANLPLIDDVLATRIAFNYDQRDSFETLGATNNDHGGGALDDLSVRLHTLYTPNDDLSMLFSYETTSRDGGMAVTVPKGSANPYNTAMNTEPKFWEENESFRYELNYDMDWAQLTYIGAWFDHQSFGLSDFDLNNTQTQSAEQLLNSKQLTHELRLASEGNEKLDWIVGLYSFSEESQRFAVVDLRPFLFIDQELPDFESESRAVFGSVTYKLSDAARIVAGLRYSEDEKTESNSYREATNRFGTFVATGSQKGDWDSTDWQLGLELDVGEDHLVFAKVGSGYKAGGFVDAISAILTNVDKADYGPEELLAFEIGHKSEFFDNRLRVNSTAYYYDYENQQLVVFFGGGNIIENADSEVYGFEVETLLAPVDNALINFSVAYSHSEYDDDSFLFDGTQNASIDVAGNRLSGSPELTTTLGIQYTWTLENGATLIPSFSYHWEDKTDLRQFGHAEDTQGQWHETDVRLTYRSVNDKWFVEGWGKNLEDPDGDDVITQSLLITGAGSRNTRIRSPMTYGIRLGYDF